uniref:BBS2_C domain-containing protein n=1 Tax=Steinernema glaseri TaxID=37863 RepID=A0A1I7ZJU7_9BILA
QKVTALAAALECTPEHCPLQEALVRASPVQPWLHRDYNIFVHQTRLYLMDEKTETNEKLALIYDKMFRLIRKDYLLRENLLNENIDGFGNLMDFLLVSRKLYPSQRIGELLAPSLVSSNISILANNLGMITYKANFYLKNPQLATLKDFVDRLSAAPNPEELLSIYKDLKEIDPGTIRLIDKAQIHEMFTFEDLMESLHFANCARLGEGHELGNVDVKMLLQIILVCLGEEYTTAMEEPNGGTTDYSVQNETDISDVELTE